MVEIYNLTLKLQQMYIHLDKQNQLSKKILNRSFRSIWDGSGAQAAQAAQAPLARRFRNAVGKLYQEFKITWIFRIKFKIL